jgi:predicted metal-dependent hydrolase
MLELVVIILAFVLMYIFFLSEYKSDGIILEESFIDGNKYWVRDLEDKSNAANTLANIKINMEKLINYLKENVDKYKDNENYEYIKNLISRTKEIHIMETPSDEKYTSYTVNKGEKIYFCLRSKVLNEIHDMNTLLYVVIHEMSHIACPEYGHTPLFYDIFRFLLRVSIDIGIYKDVDYRYKPQDYCGMTINEYILTV